MTAVAAAPPQPLRTVAKPNPYPWYSPRFWHGMRPGAWWRLCARHGFRIHPTRWPMAVLISLITPLNALMGAVQRWRYGRLIDQAQPRQPPVFIIGHWRSGTTLMHELMHLDQRFVSPTTYQCFAPHHCLLTEWLMTRYGTWLIPKQRPMDNMAAGWDRPQEDEFALLTLGAPTPYLRMAFPNEPPPYGEFLDMVGCAADDLERFEQALLHFVKLLTFATGRRVLLKSPPHTGRVELLARLFPGARFVHIVRHPFALFPSTVRLWKSLDRVQGLQYPRDEHLEDYVFDCLVRMYRGFEAQRRQLPPGTIADVRYETLVADPLGQIARIYRELELGDFEPVRPQIAAFLAAQRDYKTNHHELSDELKAQIRSRWADYFDRYGYS